MNQRERRRNRGRSAQVLVLLTALVVALALVACGGSSPTSSTRPNMLLTSASLSVDGQPVNGQTLSMSRVRNGVSSFKATLLRDGMPYPGQRIEVSYQRPGSMGMMGHGTFMLYDDGTHGDDVSGDGIYCYRDDDDDYGCTGMNAGGGDYHYDFCGYDAAGQASNHMEVTVTVSGN